MENTTSEQSTIPTFTNVTTAPKDSRFYVSNKYESLDYDRLDNEVLVEEEEIKGRRFVIGIIVVRVLLFILIGIFTGIVGTIIDIGVYYGSIVRYSFLFDASYIYLDTKFSKITFLWILSIFCPAFIAAVLVAYGEPLAQGGGTHLVLSYLNGINLRHFMKYKIVVIKVISLILTVTSGLPAGKEAPMAHIGATVGCLTPLMSWRQFQPFNYFHQDPERRDMGAAGAAAGFTAAFGTPIAGIMIAFEESLTFWSAELTFLIFISSLTSFFTLKFLVNTIMFDCLECVASKENVLLETMVGPDKTYNLMEIPLFILFGVIGGVLGGLWNMLQDQFFFFRKRVVDTPAKKLIEVTLVIFLNGLIQIFSVKYLEDYCVVYRGEGNLTESRNKPSEIKLHCKKDNEFSAAGLFFYQNTGGVFRSLFTENESPVGLLPLTMFGLYYYFASCLLMGCTLAHGIFMPHIVIGNVWGRGIAEFINQNFPNSIVWARPNKYAFLCGASQLCGTLRTTFTICVMMLESCNNVKLAIPIFLIVFTSRFIGNLITIPICPRMCTYQGIPLLEREPPPLLTHIKVRDIISSEPVVTLPVAPTYATVKKVLSKSTHNGFPIVSSETPDPNDTTTETTSEPTNFKSYGTLKGLILRTQIKALLKHHKIFIKERYNIRKRMNVIRQEHASVLMEEPIKINKGEEDRVLNLKPFMNSTPHFVHMDSSLPHAYRIFSGLGLRHLIVVNNQYEVVGMITRKDLSVFRFIRYGPYMDVMKLPTREK